MTIYLHPNVLARRSIELEALQLTAALTEGLPDHLDVKAVHALVLSILEKSEAMNEAGKAKVMEMLGVADGLD